jgi:hypothetical protein
MSATKLYRSVIPSASSPGALTVCDGTVMVGTIIVRNGSFFAFDAIGIPIGEFETQREAVFSIPKATP